MWPLAYRFATSFEPVREVFDATWERLIAKPQALVLVAEEGDGAVVGYLLAHSHLAFFANGPVVWVEEVMVDEDRRGGGIGRCLMEHAEAWATSIGAAYAALATRRAATFYRALGYEESAVFFRKLLL